MLQLEDHRVIEIDRRLGFRAGIAVVHGRELFVAQQLSNYLVMSGTGFEEEFGRNVAELMRGQMDACLIEQGTSDLPS